MSFKLSEDGAVKDKLYKLTWVVKIGKNVTSGEDLDFFIRSDVVDLRTDLTVVVK